jgi:hypothetical protein
MEREETRSSVRRFFKGLKVVANLWSLGLVGDSRRKKSAGTFVKEPVYLQTVILWSTGVQVAEVCVIF